MKERTKRKLLAVAFPERCPYCRKVIKPCEIYCKACKKKLPDHSYEKNIYGGYKVISASPYRGAFSDAIKRIKFGRKKQYAYQLGIFTAKAFKKATPEHCFDIITAVPLHTETMNDRGFNQSELLAKGICEILGTDYKELLVKTRKNKPQHELAADKRRNNVKGVFECIDKTHVKGKNILLVDDIVTTGFTLAECASILNKAGANSVCCLTFAITLPKTT